MQNPLNSRQQALIPVAALAVEGNIAALAAALDTALDTGLTINELKETLVQLYAYCGFPRSLNALSCLMKVITERQARGVIDNEGATATPLPENWVACRPVAVIRHNWSDKRSAGRYLILRQLSTVI